VFCLCEIGCYGVLMLVSMLNCLKAAPKFNFLICNATRLYAHLWCKRSWDCVVDRIYQNSFSLQRAFFQSQKTAIRIVSSVNR